MNPYVKIETTKDGETHLKVSVSFQKAQTNILNGHDEPAGVYVFVQPVIRDGTFERFVIGRGRKFKVMDLKRNNADKVLGCALQIMGDLRAKEGTGWEFVVIAAQAMGLTLTEQPAAV